MAAPNWVNRTLWTGDNLDVMRGMNSESVDLIYLDPPFNSNRTYAAPVGSKAAGASFKDAWTLSDLDRAWMGLIADKHPAMYGVLQAARLSHGKGMQSYLCMMAVRFMEMQRLLKPTGSVYLHCDPTASHYLKLLMDTVFGRANFRNEIVWYYTNKLGTGGRVFDRQHDTLLWYSRDGDYSFRALKETVKRAKPQPVTKKVDGQRIWLRDDGGKRMYRVSATKRIGDVWSLPIINPMSKERVGYPTQKPLALLRRIFEASSEPGDVILDPFAGCATACVAADKLQRQWVGIDLSPKAVELVNVRLKEALGGLYHYGLVTTRTDIPKRTDIDEPVNYREHKHELFGMQEGLCGGCRSEFPYRAFEVDHIIPRARGGARPFRQPATALLVLQPHQGRPAPGIPDCPSQGTRAVPAHLHPHIGD